MIWIPGFGSVYKTIIGKLCRRQWSQNFTPKRLYPNHSLLIIWLYLSFSRHPWHGAIGQDIFLVYISILLRSWFFKSWGGLLYSYFGCGQLWALYTTLPMHYMNDMKWLELQCRPHFVIICILYELRRTWSMIRLYLYYRVGALSKSVSKYRA